MKTINNVLTTVTDQQTIQKATESPQRLLDNTEQVRGFINDLFRALKACYPAWRQAFSTEQEYKDARLMWTRAMAEAGIRSMDQVRKGVEAARRDPSDFMPGPGKFVQWCKPSPDELGMPTMPNAWREVCDNCHRILDHEWSHPGVYEAGRRMGWFALRTSGGDRRDFANHYAEVVEAITNGAVFDLPTDTSNLLECHRNGAEIRTEQNKAAAADALAKLRGSFR